MNILISTLLLAVSPAVHGFPSYQSTFPNGNNVQHEGSPWPGVGHNNRGGGGSLNAFGSDYRAAGRTWTKDLCQKDSDGDGLTNGEELGDPDCVWKQGDTPARTSFITHPGLFNQAPPTPSPTEPDFTFCEGNGQTGTETFSMVFPGFSLETDPSPIYAKQAFQTPAANGTDIYIVKISPVVDQTEFVKSMLIYDCGEFVAQQFNDSVKVDGAMPCQKVIFAWSQGDDPFCMPENVGFKVPADSSSLLVEIKYTAGGQQAVDNSGFELTFVTDATKGANFVEADVALFGPASATYTIPPGLESYEVAGRSVVSRNEAIVPTDGLNVFATLLHGHQIAKSLWSTVLPVSNETSPFLSSCVESYNYETQSTGALKTQYKLFGGDQLTVHCIFDSIERSENTTSGSSFSQEMCTTLFFYYPAVGGSAQFWTTDVDQGIPPLETNDNALTCALPSTTQPPPSSAAGSRFGDVLAAVGPGFAAHALLMITSWGLLIPGATLLPVLFKNNKSTIVEWLPMHRGIMVLGAVLTVVAGILALVSKSGHFDSGHGTIGLVVVLFALGQLVNGVMRPHRIPTAPRQPRQRVIWEYVHQWTGRLVLVLAFANVLIGFDRLQLYSGIDSNGANVLMYIIVVIVSSIILATFAYKLYEHTHADQHATVVSNCPQNDLREQDPTHTAKV